MTIAGSASRDGGSIVLDCHRTDYQLASGCPRASYDTTSTRLRPRNTNASNLFRPLPTKIARTLLPHDTIVVVHAWSRLSNLSWVSVYLPTSETELCACLKPVSGYRQLWRGHFTMTTCFMSPHRRPRITSFRSLPTGRDIISLKLSSPLMIMLGMLVLHPRGLLL